ncbi:hypothetical protein TB2_045369 [Malus domestica]
MARVETTFVCPLRTISLLTGIRNLFLKFASESESESSLLWKTKNIGESRDGWCDGCGGFEFDVVEVEEEKTSDREYVGGRRREKVELQTGLGQ